MFSPVALEMTPGTFLGQTGVRTWDKPTSSQGQSQGFLLILHNGTPACPRDKPSLSLGQTRERRAAEKLYVLKVYVPFSLARKSIFGLFLASFCWECFPFGFPCFRHLCLLAVFHCIQARHDRSTRGLGTHQRKPTKTILSQNRSERLYW